MVTTVTEDGLIAEWNRNVSPNQQASQWEPVGASGSQGEPVGAWERGGSCWNVLKVGKASGKALV